MQIIETESVGPDLEVLRGWPDQWPGDETFHVMTVWWTSSCAGWQLYTSLSTPVLAGLRLVQLSCPPHKPNWFAPNERNERFSHFVSLQLRFVWVCIIVVSDWSCRGSTREKASAVVRLTLLWPGSSLVWSASRQGAKLPPAQTSLPVSRN